MAETNNEESTGDKVLMPWGCLYNIYWQKAQTHVVFCKFFMIWKLFVHSGLGFVDVDVL